MLKDYIESLVHRFGCSRTALKVFDEMPYSIENENANDNEVHATIDDKVLDIEIVDDNHPSEPDPLIAPPIPTGLIAVFTSALMLPLDSISTIGNLGNNIRTSKDHIQMFVMTTPIVPHASPKPSKSGSYATLFHGLDTNFEATLQWVDFGFDPGPIMVHQPSLIGIIQPIDLNIELMTHTSTTTFSANCSAPIVPLPSGLIAYDSEGVLNQSCDVMSDTLANHSLPLLQLWDLTPSPDQNVFIHVASTNLDPYCSSVALFFIYEGGLIDSTVGVAVGNRQIQQDQLGIHFFSWEPGILIPPPDPYTTFISAQNPISIISPFQPDLFLPLYANSNLLESPTSLVAKLKVALAPPVGMVLTDKLVTTDIVLFHSRQGDKHFRWKGGTSPTLNVLGDIGHQVYELLSNSDVDSVFELHHTDYVTDPISVAKSYFQWDVKQFWLVGEAIMQSSKSILVRLSTDFAQVVLNSAPLAPKVFILDTAPLPPDPYTTLPLASIEVSQKPTHIVAIICTTSCSFFCFIIFIASPR
ncbi:hypothetical protein Hdeb2414_s0069g00771391 [Helianthus debilis subsp. tardiflorus]